VSLDLLIERIDLRQLLSPERVASKEIVRFDRVSRVCRRRPSCAQILVGFGGTESGTELLEW
jgi:hypothetical protein